LLQFIKVFSLVFSIGLTLLPGHHATSVRTSTGSVLGSTLVEEQPRTGALKPDGETVPNWTAAESAFEAEVAAEQAKEAADAAAAAAAAPRLSFTANPGAAAVQNLIRQAFAPLGSAAVDWGLRVAACESGYNPNAYNPDGASGVFQFMPGTFRATPYGSQNIFDATANVDAAAWYYGRYGGGAWSCK
jgi:soluble lytic murein transglycosylase-like protein